MILRSEWTKLHRESSFQLQQGVYLVLRQSSKRDFRSKAKKQQAWLRRSLRINDTSLIKQKTYNIIIQHIVTMFKYGHSVRNIRRAYSTDILRYT